MTLTASPHSDLAHLLRRAGFGVAPEDWAAYAKLGLGGTTDRLLHADSVEEPVDALLKQMGEDVFNFDDLNSVKKWWLFRMARTQRPLVEKMTLFWHNHFATANYKVDNAHWMWKQNQILRAHALGKFGTLLQAISRDAAMLSWLDGGENRKTAPNENFGRELLELFTLGVDGGYTEADVKAAARAFTGWHWDEEKQKAVFDPEQHDDGVKTFLGKTGRFQADDICKGVSVHPATAHFICTKLLRFFQQDEPSEGMVSACTRVYLQTGGEIAPTLGAILRSPAFYAPEARYARFKSPTEYALILLRTLGIPLAYGGDMHEALAEMGQDLFNPPDVKGWREGKVWFNTTTLTARQAFAQQMLDSLDQRGKVQERLRAALKAFGRDPDALTTPEKLVDALWQLLLPGHTPSARTRAALIACAPPVPGEGEKPEDVKNKPLDLDARAPVLLRLLLITPEYQLA